MAELTLDLAEKIADAAFARGRELDLKPLTIAVIDVSGELKLLKRADGAAPLRPNIALGKAWGALWLDMPSAAIAGMANERPSFFGAIANGAPGKIVPAAGGILLKDASGAVLGAVGISGDLSEKDEDCAIAGREAAGLTG